MKKLINDTIKYTIVIILAVLVSWVIFEKESNNFEIERKWLIDTNDIPYNLEEDTDKYDITQTYINYSPEIRVREIKNNENTYYTMTVKRYINNEALTREEYDFEITKEEYDNTVVKGIDNTINKTRYQINIDGLTYAFDVFHGSLEGLAYLEIEFESENQANRFKEPEWIIKDITNDKSYKNQSLAKFGIPEN